MKIILNVDDNITDILRKGTELIITDTIRNIDGSLILNVQLIDKIDVINCQFECI